MSEEAITSKSGENKKAAENASNSKGLYNVKFLKDHGTNKKDQDSIMHHSTAKALEFHKVVKIGTKVTKVAKPKR